MIYVNVKGVLYCFAAALPVMTSQSSGHITNLSSVAGHKIFPGFAVYCGTKYSVRAITEGFRQEAGADSGRQSSPLAAYQPSYPRI